MNKKDQNAFVTVLKHGNTIYYGILKIKSKQYISIYCLNEMSEDECNELIRLGYDWWWQSNRMIPISLFMKEEMENYEQYTKRFNTDSVQIISGPVISLSDLPTKRIKRRNVALKRKK